MTRWKDKSYAELADEADRGLRGQGSIVETRRRDAVAMQDLTTAVRAAGDCTATQNAQMLKLTGSMKTLTWVIIGLAVVQIVIAIVTRGGA